MTYVTLCALASLPMGRVGQRKEETAAQVLRNMVYPQSMKGYVNDFEVPVEVTQHGSMTGATTKK